MEPINFKLTGSKDSKTCASAISKASTFETISHFNFIYCKIHSYFSNRMFGAFSAWSARSIVSNLSSACNIHDCLICEWYICSLEQILMSVERLSVSQGWTHLVQSVCLSDTLRVTSLCNILLPCTVYKVSAQVRGLRWSGIR